MEAVGEEDQRPIPNLDSTAHCAAETAIIPIYSQYGSFAAKQVSQIERLLNLLEGSPSPDKWQSLSAAIHDLRSSSATFGAQSITDFAGAWERALDPQLRGCEKIFEVMRIHLHSLKLALQRALPIDQQNKIKGELSKVVHSLRSEFCCNAHGGSSGC